MKQAILIRKDLKMGKGKIATQCAHASLDAAFKTLKKKRRKFASWKLGGMKKVVLKVQNLKELKQYLAKAKREKLIISIISDAGLTQIKRGSITAVAIGPDDDLKIDRITGKLKLL